jgi:hypothetical protein
LWNLPAQRVQALVLHFGQVAHFFGVEVRWPDPDSAAGFRAVDSVAGVVFVVLFVEVDFEFEIKKVFDV